MSNEKGRSNTARRDTGATPGGTSESAADKEERGGGEAGEAARTAGETGNQKEESVRTGGNDNTQDGLASQPRRYQVPVQPLLNRHQVGPQPSWAVSTARLGARQGRTRREGMGG